MISPTNHLSFHATSNNNVRILVDGLVHPRLAGFPGIREALMMLVQILNDDYDIEDYKVHLSEHCYFIFDKHACPVLVDEGRNVRPEEAGQDGFAEMMALADKIKKAENNGEVVSAVAGFRKKMREELLPDFDPKCLDFGHKRIPASLVKFMTADFDLLGSLDTSYEVKAFGDERLMGQLVRLQKSITKLPESTNRNKLQGVVAALTLALSDLQQDGTCDWVALTLKEFKHVDAGPFGDEHLLFEARSLGAQIEHLPAGFHATQLSVHAHAVSHALQNLQAHGKYFWPGVGEDYPPAPKPMPSFKQKAVQGFTAEEYISPAQSRVEVPQFGTGLSEYNPYFVISMNLDKAYKPARGVTSCIAHIDEGPFLIDGRATYVSTWDFRDPKNPTVSGTPRLGRDSFNDATMNQIAAIQILAMAGKVADNIQATSANEPLVHPYPASMPQPTKF